MGSFVAYFHLISRRVVVLKKSVWIYVKVDITEVLVAKQVCLGYLSLLFHVVLVVRGELSTFRVDLAALTLP